MAVSCRTSRIETGSGTSEVAVSDGFPAEAIEYPKKITKKTIFAINI